MSMEENKKEIWAYHSMKKGIYDNDYYFDEDGTILHRYDRTMKDYNLESYVSPDSISDSDKEKIVAQCTSECNKDIVEKIKRILDYE